MFVHKAIPCASKKKEKITMSNEMKKLDKTKSINQHDIYYTT